MRSRRPYRPGIGKEAEALLLAGHTHTEVMNKLDVSPSVVSNAARRLGIGQGPREKPTPRYDWAEVRAYHEAGNNTRAVIRKFRMSPSTLHAAKVRGDFPFVSQA